MKQTGKFWEEVLTKSQSEGLQELFMVVFWQLVEKHWTTRIWLRRCENKFLRQCPAKCVDLWASTCIANIIPTVSVGRDVRG